MFVGPPAPRHVVASLVAKHGNAMNVLVTWEQPESASPIIASTVALTTETFEMKAYQVANVS